MKTLFAILVLAFGLVTIGCGANHGGRASFVSEPGNYKVSGHTHNPEAMVRTASDAYVQQQQMDRCWDAYDAGEAVACPGSYGSYGNYGGDAFFYGYGPGSTIDNGTPVTDPAAAARAEKNSEAAVNATKKILKLLAEEE